MIFKVFAPFPTGVDYMSINTAINSASASLEMEGFVVSDELKQLCARKINNEISMEEYIKLAMELNRVKI